MKFVLLLCIALLPVLLSVPARAQDFETIIGSGLVCATAEEVERFVSIYDGDIERAVETVNEDADDPNACVVATFAYVQGPAVATLRTDVGAFRIIQVLVVGVLTELGFELSIPEIFFSVVEVEELGV